jgi:hypothetical protein
VQGDAELLTFQIANGRWVVVQASAALGWNSAELAQFASGVEMLVSAQRGRG